MPACFRAPDGPGLAALAILALPYLESDTGIFRSAPHGRDLIEALAAARRATVLAHREAEAVSRLIPELGDARKKEAEKRKAQAIELAREAVAELEAALAQAEAPGAARRFLRRWVRNELRVTPTAPSARRSG